MTDDLISPKRAAQLLGVSTKHLAKMSDRGCISVVRLPSGHRRYSAAEMKRIREGKNMNKKLIDSMIQDACFVERLGDSMPATVHDLCCHVKALASYVDDLEAVAPGITSDHSLLLAAIFAGKATWEPFPSTELSGYGNIRIAGIAYTTRLDGFRCPLLYDGVREMLRAALLTGKGNGAYYTPPGTVTAATAES